MGLELYLTNAAAVAAVARGTSSSRSREAVGSGPAYSIMRHPREFEQGAGRVLALTPPSRLAKPAIEAKHAYDLGDDLAADAWREYEAGLRSVWERPDHRARLAPGLLTWGRPALLVEDDGTQVQTWDGERWVRGGRVEPGATLFCACSREAAQAGRCHRVVAAQLLASVGWDVVLDGARVR